MFRVRLRKKTWKNPGTVFLDYHVYEEDISISSNWEVFLEVLNGNTCYKRYSILDLFFWYFKRLLKLMLNVIVKVWFSLLVRNSCKVTSSLWNKQSEFQGEKTNKKYKYLLLPEIHGSILFIKLLLIYNVIHSETHDMMAHMLTDSSECREPWPLTPGLLPVSQNQRRWSPCRSWLFWPADGALPPWSWGPSRKWFWRAAV